MVLVRLVTNKLFDSKASTPGPDGSALSSKDMAVQFVLSQETVWLYFHELVKLRRLTFVVWAWTYNGIPSKGQAHHFNSHFVCSLYIGDRVNQRKVVFHKIEDPQPPTKIGPGNGSRGS